MRKKDWLVAWTLALCAVGLVACGGGSGSGGGESARVEEEGLEFTECLRAHGVEVEDPKPGQTNIEVGEEGDPASKRALAACNGKLGGAGQELSPEEGEAFREGALADLLANRLWLAHAGCKAGRTTSFFVLLFLGKKSAGKPFSLSPQ